MQKQTRVKKESKTLLKHRLEILEAAHSIFLELGIGKTTIREIAHKVKMTKRTIFNYFETKDILAEELQIHLIRKMSSSYIVNFSEGINELSKIRAFLDGFLYSSQESIKMIQYIAAFDNYYIHGYPTSNYGMEVAKIMEPFYQLIPIFIEGQEKGIIRRFPFVEPVTMFLSIFQMFNSYVQRFYYRQEALKEEGYPDAMGDPKFIIDLIILGLASSPEHIPPR
jgi:AcrR family transcriptional regulator